MLLSKDLRYENFHEMFGGVKKPIIGMLHLDGLPDSPIYKGKGLKPVIEKALKDAYALKEGGVNGLQIENFNVYSP